MMFSSFYRVASAEKALFKSSGVIHLSPPPFSLPGKPLTDKRDSDGFFQLEGYVYMASHRSNKMTGSSLIVAH